MQETLTCNSMCPSMLTSRVQLTEQRHRKLEACCTAAHLTYLLKSGCTKVRWGHRRFPMYPGIPDRHPYFLASSACIDVVFHRCF